MLFSNNAVADPGFQLEEGPTPNRETDTVVEDIPYTGVGTSGMSGKTDCFSTNFLRVSNKPEDSSSSQFAPAECGDTRLLTNKDFVDVTKA